VARHVQAARDLGTDASGRVFVDLPPGRYNLLASSADDTRKAWRSDLRVAGNGILEAAPIPVRPNGRIEERVRTVDPGITDLLTAEAFIPGSVLQAKTTRDGRSVIEGMPESQFEVFAWHPDLGEAYLDLASAIA